MLPQLNENGDLPPGVHAAGWTEIAQRFGAGSSARVRALATLKHLHELAVRTGALRAFYVFGSFVSATPAPRESLTLFSHADAEARYNASVFWLREGMLSDAAMREFLRVWQTKRNGTVRGILEVA